MTYALMRSFSHASHGAGHAPSSHITPYVPVTGVPNPRPLKTCDLEAGTCMLDGDRPAGVDGVGVTASSISSVCVLCELVLTGMAHKGRCGMKERDRLRGSRG